MDIVLIVAWIWWKGEWCLELEKTLLQNTGENWLKIGWIFINSKYDKIYTLQKLLVELEEKYITSTRLLGVEMCTTVKYLMQD